MPTDHALVSTTKAVAYLAERGLSVTDETLRRWADDRKVVHIRLPSGQVRFRPADLDALVEPIQPAGDAA